MATKHIFTGGTPVKELSPRPLLFIKGRMMRRTKDLALRQLLYVKGLLSGLSGVDAAQSAGTRDPAGAAERLHKHPLGKDRGR